MSLHVRPKIRVASLAVSAVAAFMLALLPQLRADVRVLSYQFSNAVFSGTSTFTAPALFADGTAAAPSIAFASDPATGFYKTASGTLRLSNGIGGIGMILNGAASVLNLTTDTGGLFVGASSDITFQRRAAGTPVTNLGGSTFSAATNSATIGGVFCVNTTSQATTGTIEEVLATCTLPANALSAGKGIRVASWAAGTGAGNKQLLLRFGGLGGTLIANMVASTVATTYSAEARVLTTGASAHVAFGTTTVSAVSTALTDSAPTQATSGTIAVVVTAITATAGQITHKGTVVEFFN